MGNVTWGYIFGPMLLSLLEGFGFTLILFSATLLFSLPLGMLVCSGRMSRFKIISWPIRFFISVMRGTPLLLQLAFVYFAPSFLFHFNWWGFRTLPAVVAFVLNYSAYFAEIFRGGIQSVSTGQREAASALGLSKQQTFFRIILPQVIKNIIPSISNEVITLVKDTSLASAAVSVTEIMYFANRSLAAKISVVPLVAAGIFYYLFNLLLAFIFQRIEKKLNYYHG